MLSSAAEGGNNAQLMGLFKAVNALAQDMPNKFGALGEMLNALEANGRQQLAPAPQVLNGHLVNTSTPTPRQRVGDTHWSKDPQPGAEWLLWADRPVDETLDYKQELSWPNEDNDTSPASSKLFSVTEATDKFLQDSFTKGVPNATRKQQRERYGDPKCPKHTHECQSSIKW